MVPHRMRRRSAGILDRFKDITRQNSKHSPQIIKVDTAPPQGILINHMADSLPSRGPENTENRVHGHAPRNSKIDPRISHGWSYWGPTRSLVAHELEALVKRHFREMSGASIDPRFRLHDQIVGSSNTFYVLQSKVKPEEKICVRVPAWGWAERWNETDAELFRAAALSMRFVKERSGLPVPEVLAYDSTMTNELGTPFIIMTFLPGVGIDQVWNGSGDENSHQIQARRQRILRSLAKTMRALDRPGTVFRKSGVLAFPDDDDRYLEVGPCSRLCGGGSPSFQGVLSAVGSQGSIWEFLKAAQLKRVAEDRNLPSSMTIYRRGVFMLWRMMLYTFFQSTRHKGEAGEFVLMHPDLSQKNVLVNEEGTVTGIIGWEGVEVVPRQMGWSSVPFWLQDDWSTNYHWPPQDGAGPTLLPDEYNMLRKEYAEYMQEACGRKGDCRFTSKSHIYQALFRSAESFEAVEQFVYNVLADILPRNVGGWRKQLGDIGRDDFRTCEKKWLESRLLDYFAPDPEVDERNVDCGQGDSF